MLSPQPISLVINESSYFTDRVAIIVPMIEQAREETDRDESANLMKL